MNYFQIIIESSNNGIPIWSFAFPAAVGSGYLVSYGENNIVENRSSDSISK